MKQSCFHWRKSGQGWSEQKGWHLHSGLCPRWIPGATLHSLGLPAAQGLWDHLDDPSFLLVLAPITSSLLHRVQGLFFLVPCWTNTSWYNTQSWLPEVAHCCFLPAWLCSAVCCSLFILHLFVFFEHLNCNSEGWVRRFCTGGVHLEMFLVPQCLQRHHVEGVNGKSCSCV